MIIGASFDTPEANAAFAQKYGFSYSLLSDLDRSLAIAYGAADDATASTARRVGVIIGPDGRILQWYARVSSSNFPKEALDLL